MQERFPLSEGLWLEWLQDECAEKRVDEALIKELYELAVKDYLSIQLWTNYVRSVLYANILPDGVTEAWKCRTVDGITARKLDSGKAFFTGL